MTKQILLYGLDLDPPKTAASPIDCELLKRAAAAHADRMKDKPRCACMATDPQQCADDRYGRRYPWEREFYDEAEPCTGAPAGANTAGQGRQRSGR